MNKIGGTKHEWIPAPEPVKNPFAHVSGKEQSKSKIEVGAASEGKEGRLNNEDAYLFDAGRGLVCVADGMGGTKNAGTASHTVMEFLTPEAINAFSKDRYGEIFNADPETPLKGYDQKDVEQTIRSYLSGVGVRVRQRAKDGDTTVTLAKAWMDEAGNRQLTVANVGDSRLYRLRKGRLDRLTNDQSLLEAVLNEGISDADGNPILDDSDVTRRISLADIQKRSKTNKILGMLETVMKNAKKDAVTLEEIRHYVLNGMNNGTGADIQTHSIESGDMYIAVSDGISDNLTDNEIANTVIRASDAEQAAKLLRIQAGLVSQDAKNPRSKPDDTTAVAMLIR